jgi:hypothetical protein
VHVFVCVCVCVCACVCLLCVLVVCAGVCGRWEYVGVGGEWGRACANVRVCSFLCLCARVRVCACVRLIICVCVCVCMCVCVCVLVRVRACGFLRGFRMGQTELMRDCPLGTAHGHTFRTHVLEAHILQFS